MPGRNGQNIAVWTDACIIKHVMRQDGIPSVGNRLST